MYVLITGTEPGPAIEEPEDLGSLHLELRGVSDEAAGDALRARGAGVVGADGHGWIELEFLRSAQTEVADDDWAGRFDQMVAYAAAQGWVSADGTRVRAHLVRS